MQMRALVQPALHHIVWAAWMLICTANIPIALQLLDMQHWQHWYVSMPSQAAAPTYCIAHSLHDVYTCFHVSKLD